jgi:hypothetical protein
VGNNASLNPVLKSVKALVAIAHETRNHGGSQTEESALPCREMFDKGATNSYNLRVIF